MTEIFPRLFLSQFSPIKHSFLQEIVSRETTKIGEEKMFHVKHLTGRKKKMFHVKQKSEGKTSVFPRIDCFFLKYSRF